MTVPVLEPIYFFRERESMIRIQSPLESRANHRFHSGGVPMEIHNRRNSRQRELTSSTPTEPLIIAVGTMATRSDLLGCRRRVVHKITCENAGKFYGLIN